MSDKSSFRKICIVTGSRAEYGLLYWLMKEIEDDTSLELQIIATGMHLSPEYGLTYKDIEKNGFMINKKIEILLSSDSHIGIAKSIGLAQISISEALFELNPDIVVLLGDRFEIFAAASAALVCNLPIAHIAGGETTFGAMDEAFRHCITKMAHIHFAGTEIYRKRIIQLGEQPQNVYNVGTIGVDNIKRLTLLDQQAFEESVGMKLGKFNFMITFHPVTLENKSSESQLKELLMALDCFPDAKLLFTKPNADAESRILIKMIDDYVSQNANRALVHTSLGQKRYLSAIQYMDAIIGNSSSGIVEVPFFRKPTINIGDRQKGRIMAKSVINCEPVKEKIINAIYFALSSDFLEQLTEFENPYDGGNTSVQIKEFLKTVDLKDLQKKEFYDIPDFSHQ